MSEDMRTGLESGPEDDVVAIVLRQHDRIRTLMNQVSNTAGHSRLQALTELTALIKAHERAEQAVLRPVGVDVEGKRSAKARTREEAAADEALLRLDGLDVDSTEFRDIFDAFREIVEEHAAAEEAHELEPMRQQLPLEERVRLGQAFLEAVGAPR
jgi:hypothetical protein